MNSQPQFIHFLTNAGQQFHQPREAEPPARVRFALKYLQFAYGKTMPILAGNDVGFHEADGGQLTPGEEDAQGAAARVLRDYFTGDYAPAEWEQGPDGGLPRDRAGLLMRCFSCTPGPAKHGCELCGGTGEILVYPSGR